MKIDNSHFVLQCPICGRNDIFNSGDIKYANPLIFADTRIELTYQPQLWICRACNSKFSQNIIHENDAIKLYIQQENNRWKYSESFEKFHTEKIVKTIKKICKPGMQILDIGCSSGSLLDFTKNLGCNVYGIEFSDPGRKDCIKKGHICFKNIQEFPPGILFDRIFCFDVIEHVYSFNQFFNQYSRFLKTGGIFCFVTGDIQGGMSRKYGPNWWYVRYPEHICFPSLEYFSQLNNYKIVEQKACYASIRHEEISLWDIVNLVKKIFKWDFDGRPSLMPDHICLLLEKTDD
ncbi:MAG: class I SAM-dependent methyltransferase [Methanoregula sp.]